MLEESANFYHTWHSLYNRLWSYLTEHWEKWFNESFQFIKFSPLSQSKSETGEYRRLRSGPSGNSTGACFLWNYEPIPTKFLHWCSWQIIYHFICQEKDKLVLASPFGERICQINMNMVEHLVSNPYTNKHIKNMAFHSFLSALFKMYEQLSLLLQVFL